MAAQLDNDYLTEGYALLRRADAARLDGDEGACIALIEEAYTAFDKVEALTRAVG